MKRGDFVKLSVGDDTFDAMVVLASENGHSLILMFDGAVRVAGGVVLGCLPVYREDDGRWTEILGGGTVGVKAKSR
jgi:hypothetical protein